MELEKSSSHKKDRSSSHHKKSSRHRRDRDGSTSPSLDESINKRKYQSDEDDNENHKRSNGKVEREISKKHRHESEKSKSGRQEKEKDSSDNLLQMSSSNGGAGNDELSIEETNKLREKLGLKPLAVTDSSKPVTETKTSTGQVKKTYIDKDTNQEFEHVPAKNQAEIKEQKTIREKLKQKREQRELHDKIHASKGIADSDEEDDSAASWLRKSKEKQEAQRKAKLLEEMDEQFGVDDIIEPKPKSTNKYDARNLRGLRVEHDQSLFQEGKDIILTLKDRNILQGTGGDIDVDNDVDADVLINVNIADDERFAKNVENKKNKPGYSAYDEFDEEGLFKEKSILDKYNEELNGVTKKSFKLDSKGTYDGSDAKFLEKLDEEHKAKAIRIDALNELKHETDYFTPTELEKFKRPKKTRRVLRKGKEDKMMKAEDLLPLATEIVPVENKRKREKVKEGFQEVKNEPLTEPKKTSKTVSLKDIDFGFDKEEESNSENSSENSDINESEDEDSFQLNQNEMNDYKEMIGEEENALEELQSILTKTRNRLTTTKSKTKDIEAFIKVKQEESDKIENEANNVDLDSLNTIKDEENDHMYLDTMSEFCKNLGHTSNQEEKVYDDNKDEEEDEDEVVEMKTDLDSSLKKNESKSDSESNNEEMDNEDNDHKNNQKKSLDESDNDEEFELLEDEPTLDRGLGSFLSLCKSKGFIDAEKKVHARPKKEHIEAINFTVEEKNHYDIDDKYNRNRDRFSGPLSDFQEKSSYKPNVKLDYIDEKGHSMNQKEAFRYLSHKFHGKGSGKKKTEKQQNKYKEKDIMAKMSMIDTPLNTVAMLVEKQKKLQQPYVVLSATKNKQEQVTLHKR